VARPYFKPVVVQGDIIDFAHLEPFSLEVESHLAKKKLRIHVTLTVESAYHQTERAPVLLGSVGFVLLCGKAYLGLPVATKR